MSPRKSFSKKDRERLYGLYAGECHICRGTIDRAVEAFEIEHVIPWALTHDDSDGNLRLAHVKCHRGKTKHDIKTISKTERMRLRHLNLYPKAKGNAVIRSRGFPKRENGYR